MAPHNKSSEQQREVRARRLPSMPSLGQTINLSEYEIVNLRFTNDRGVELFSVRLERHMEQSPQVLICLHDQSGRLHTGLTMFNVDAPRKRRRRK